MLDSQEDAELNPDRRPESAGAREPLGYEAEGEPPLRTIRAGFLRGQELGPYVLVERLGGGAMATVYRAIDRRNQRQVAVKILLPDADAIMRERFRREAQTHRVLDHPNIVRIYDVGESRETGLTYIVMELVEGPNLSEVMEETLRMSPVDTARLLEPIARALDYSGRQGIIHRDVKPSNVLLRRVAPDRPDAIRLSSLDEPVLPLLSDFGIARALDAPELTSAGRTVGTPTYMSPEQCADSHEIDGRSDLYSLGAVFYRCIVGRPPYSGSTTQILHAHVYDPLTIPEEVLGTLPPAAVTILRRSLAKEPSQRYANGAEMAADLRALLGDAGASGDDTATMAALPSVRQGATQAVLIPGPELLAAGGAASRPADFIPVEAVPLRPVTPAALPRRRPRRRWIGALIGAALAAVVLLGGAGLAFNLLPEGLVATLAATPSAAPAVARGATPTNADRPDLPNARPETAGAGSETPPGETVTSPAAPAAASPTPPPKETPDVASSTPSPPAAASTGTIALLLGTPSILPTPAGNIEDFWEEARAAFADQDWDGTLAYLTFVRRMNPQFERPAVEELLFDSWIGLAAQYLGENQLEAASELLDAALALRPAEPRVAEIARNLDALISPDRSDTQMARWTLARALLVHGANLADAGKPCLAAAQLEAAGRVLPDQDVPELVAANRVACIRARLEEAARAELAKLQGELLYSTYEGNRYRLYRMPAALDGASTLLLDDATQPARQRLGSLLAYRSTAPAAEGIAVVDLRGGGGTAARGEELTTAPGDAHDGPPGWNPAARRLVYASTVIDNRSRIFVVDAAGPGEPTDLVPGRDPAWHPVADSIVYNGVDDAGGNPGLWLMNSAGGARTQLTANGNDIRPAWTPDGQTVVFMSQRDGNYEVYRIDLADSRILRLTNDPAQDGLPAVSPDGKWVAFASDRGGFWRIWVTPIDGGDAYPLANINGELTSWLEHAIQWVP